MIELPRFRAGYDFLALRAESGEISMEIADWWHEFQNADHAEREAMLIPDAVPNKKRRRSRVRKSNGDPATSGPEDHAPAEGGE